MRHARIPRAEVDGRYAEGAEPGDTLEVHILKIVPKSDGFNFNVPGKDFPTVGQLASEFPEGFVRYYKLDLDRMQTTLPDPRFISPCSRRAA